MNEPKCYFAYTSIYYICYFGRDWLYVQQSHFIFLDTTITTFLSLSWNSGRVTQLVLAKNKTWPIPPARAPSLAPHPLTSWMKMVQEELSEEAQGDGEPQDGRSPGL